MHSIVHNGLNLGGTEAWTSGNGFANNLFSQTLSNEDNRNISRGNRVIIDDNDDEINCKTISVRVMKNQNGKSSKVNTEENNSPMNADTLKT